MCAYIWEGTFLLWAGLALEQPPLCSVGAAQPSPGHFCTTASPRDEPGGEQLSVGKPRQVWMLCAYMGDSVVGVKYRICKQGLYF